MCIIYSVSAKKQTDFNLSHLAITALHTVYPKTNEHMVEKGMFRFSSHLTNESSQNLVSSHFCTQFSLNHHVRGIHRIAVPLQFQKITRMYCTKRCVPSDLSVQ